MPSPVGRTRSAGLILRPDRKRSHVEINWEHLLCVVVGPIVGSLVGQLRSLKYSNPNRNEHQDADGHRWTLMTGQGGMTNGEVP